MQRSSANSSCTLEWLKQAKLKLLFFLAWHLETYLCQVTFTVSRAHKLNLHGVQSDIYGCSLSEIKTQTLATSTQFKYLVADQYRQISLQSTTKMGKQWSVSQLSGFPERCDLFSNIGKVVSIPNTGYFYGTSIQIGTTTSNCSTGLFSWDVTALPNGSPSYLRSFFPASPSPLKSLDLVAIGSEFLVLSNQSYIRVSDNLVSSLNYVQASIHLDFMTSTTLQSWPVWAVDQSTTTVVIYSLNSVTGSFYSLNLNGLPPVSATVRATKRLGSAYSGMMLLATRTSMLIMSSSQTYPLVLPGSSSEITSLVLRSDISQYAFTLLRGMYLEAYTLTTAPNFGLEMITQVDVSAYNLAAGNIQFADPSTLVAISANSNQILFFDAVRACDPACKTCSGPTNAGCLACGPQARKDSTSPSTCYLCGEGFVATADQTACLACATGCSSCPSRENTPESACQKCFSGLFKDQADPKMCRECPSSGYYLGSGNLCVRCSANCVTCTGTTVCTLCGSGYYLLNSACSSCDTVNCDQCANSGIDCVKCKPGYYFSTANTCTRCDDSDCDECFGSGLLKCTNCRDGFYLELFNNTCQPCLPNCKTCSNQEGCTSCKYGFTIVQSLSLSLPPTCQNCSDYSGYYLYQQLGIQYCDKCSSNCTSCTGLSTNCTSCAEHYYLMNTVCYNCRENCTRCESPWDCTNCTSGTFLSSTNRSCTVCGDGYFIDTDGLTCKPCSDNCLRCTGASACIVCDIGKDFYRASTGLCIHLNTFLPTEGIDAADNSVKPCIDVHCINCRNDYSNCSSCDTINSWYRLNSGCILKSSLVLNQGIDQTNLSVQDCSEQHCTNCTDNYQICRRCDFQNNWFLNSTGACVTGALIPAGQGINRQNSTVQACMITNCALCQDDYLVCTQCDTLNGFSLVNTTCRPSLWEASLQQVPASTSDQDLSWQVNLVGNFSTDVLKSALTSLQQTAIIMFKFFTIKSGDEHSSGLVITKIAGSSSLSVAGKFSTYLPENQYRVDVSLLNLSFVHSDGTTYYISAASASTTYDNPVDLAQAKVLKQQQAAGQLLSSVAPGSSPAAGSITLAVIAMDPTGTFFRFTKMLQILGRVYHLNINFGKRLDAFLLKTASGEKANPDDLVRHSRQTRGKLSTHLVPLDSVRGQLLWKICLYWCLWFLWVASLLVQRSPKLYKSKAMIYFTFLLSRAHWAVFNLIFGELLWLLPRTVLHSRRLSFGVYFGTAVTFPLVVCDFVYLLRLISSRERWGRFAVWASPNFTEKKLPAKAQAKTEVKADVPNPENQPQTKQINYKKTYFEIGCNFPLMEMVSGSFIPREIIGDSVACRYLCLSPWFRLVFIQLLISSCQYASQLAVTLMLIHEVCKGLTTVFVHFEHKLFLSIPTLVSEILQSLFLSIIWCLLLFQSSRRFDEPVSDRSQDATVWLILISCLIEYMMLLVFIAKLLWDFWRARHLMFRLGVQKASPSFIHYVRKDEQQHNLAENSLDLDVKNIQLGESTSKLFTSMNPRNRLSPEPPNLSRSLSSLNSTDQLNTSGAASPQKSSKHLRMRSIFQKK